jgi:predicted protein tyrosine phosphatase
MSAADRPHLGQLNLAAQGDYKRVLFVCSGGMLRSATAAQWAATVLDWNTRSCGTLECALPPPHANLIEWAQVIYCMEPHHRDALAYKFPWALDKMEVLDIPDRFEYRHPELVAWLETRFAAEMEKAS